jgi:hypothetical protein
MMDTIMLNSSKPAQATKLPPEIQNVINCAAELHQVSLTLRNSLAQLGGTPGITAQEFKERASTDYIQNLFIAATGGIARTRQAIKDIPDTPPT